MAVQTEAEREANYAKWMREHIFPTGVFKVDLRAAYDAADDWVEEAKAGPAPTTSFRANLPNAFDTAAQPRDRARLWAVVLNDRFNLDLF